MSHSNCTAILRIYLRNMILHSLRPGFVPGLAPPKIPDGEKVDFDVSSPENWFLQAVILF